MPPEVALHEGPIGTTSENYGIEPAKTPGAQNLEAGVPRYGIEPAKTPRAQILEAGEPRHEIETAGASKEK